MLSKRRLIPLLTTLVLAGITVAYLFFLERRGLNTRLYNKAAGDVSVLLLGMVLLIGPFSRWFNLFDQWLAYRKNLGLWTLLAAVIHGYLSLFVISNGNFMRYFTSFNTAFYSGLLALVILLVLGWLSVDKLIGKMDKKLWWKIQQWGVRLTALLVMAHVLILKWPGWNFAEFLTKIPPFNFVISLFAALVLAVRLIDLVKKSN